jgi:flagellar biosynthesis protein
MNQPLPPTDRKVSLQLARDTVDLKAMPAETLESLLERARAMGIPMHHEPQIAGLLSALRLRDDVPVQLYAAAASVLASVYDAANE